MNIKVPFEIVELEKNSYHLLVKCLVNDVHEGDLIIDTGASKTVLDRNFVKNYQVLETDEETIQSSGLGSNNIETKMVEIPSLRIGALEISSPSLALIDLTSINEMYEKYCQRRISGLLGSDFLLRYHTCIDYHRQILLFQNVNQSCLRT